MATDTEAQYAWNGVHHRHHRRRRSRRTMSPSIPSSPSGPRAPSPVPDKDDDDDDDDDMDDPNILSPLDPRRFTPTLHASLVSEILNLRREVEGRTKFIEDLEQGLHEFHAKNDALNDNVAQSSRQVRSLKHQIQLLEGGSSSALTELTRERDEALEGMSDLRQKLGSAQKKARVRETELSSSQVMWNHEKGSWQTERRNLERKIHIVEGRLKIVLNEVAAADREAGSLSRDNPAEQRASVASLRSDDGKDIQDRRKSTISVDNGQANNNNNNNNNNENSGLSLAEELELDDEEEDLVEDEDGLMDDDQNNPPTLVSSMSAAAFPPEEERASPLPKRPKYCDAGIQYSLPADVANGSSNEKEIFSKDNSTMTQVVFLVSTSCQTDELSEKQVATATASTQTDTKEKKELPFPVPTIEIHPPESEAPSARTSVVLPPQTQSVSCQANIAKTESRSAGMQTEAIQIIRWPEKQPSLLPSAIPDLPLNEPTESTTNVKPSAGAKKEKPTGSVQTYLGSNDNGPLSANDIVSGKSEIRRPLRSSSLFAGFEQLSGGEEVSDAEDTDVFTDDDMFNRPFTLYPVKKSPRGLGSGGGDTLFKTDEPGSDSEVGTNNYELVSRPTVRSRNTKARARKGQTGSGPKEVNMRRAAMISSGAATHQRMDALSPSSGKSNGAVSAGSSVAPPIPVPERFSSKNQARRNFEGRQSPGSTQSPTPSKQRKTSSPSSELRKPSLVRRPAIRQPRTSPTVNLKRRGRSNGWSSPKTSNLSDSPPSARLPLDDINNVRTRPKLALNNKSSAPAPEPYHVEYPQSSPTTAATVHPTSIVDAIAQTMVGEWMFKYVRRRRSFGVNETRENWDGRHVDVPGTAGRSGVRHKRWVWLAPYERSIMWSSKQPTNSPALLGKSGRKRETERNTLLPNPRKMADLIFYFFLFFFYFFGYTQSSSNPCSTSRMRTRCQKDSIRRTHSTDPSWS